MALGLLLIATVIATAPVGADVFPMNQHNFRIPIHVDPAHRTEIKELLLFASTDQGKTWQEAAVASPDQDGFPYYASSDGVYWFTVCIVDQQGRRDPPDIYKVPPSEKILVDTLRPVIRITSATRQGEDVLVAWEIQEDNPDLATFKLEYRVSDGSANVWYPVPAVQTLIGQARFRVTAIASPVTVRLQLQDQAGNNSTATSDITAASTVTASSATQTATVPPIAGLNSPPAVTPPVASWTPPPVIAQPLSVTPPAESRPPTAYTGAVLSNYGASQGAEAGSRPVASTDIARANPLPQSGTAIRSASGQLPVAQLVNATQVALDYEVKAGPSGIAKVDIWLTRDDGRTWDLFKSQTEAKSPLILDLPGDGIYGFSIAVQSQAGLAKRPPQSGDTPEVRVEVDTTAPEAQLYAPEADVRQKNALVLTWLASDHNLAPNPITLQWSASRDGSWQTIAADIPNTGHHVWRLPQQIPAQVYLRLLARDTAGNVGIAETPRPVLIDLTEPEGRLLSISVIPRQP